MCRLLTRLFTLIILSGFFAGAAGAQGMASVEPSGGAQWGKNDTITVSVIEFGGALIPYRELDNIYVSNMNPQQLAKAVAAYNRLRNAVYVTYPYARTAGATLNDVAAHLVGVDSRSDRKAYIKTREKELRKQFAEPLENLSVYQGKVLMKLINRQTGNNCYEIIKDYKGGVNARVYQTVAFFFGSSLKQPYDLNDGYDRQIENIVKEIDGSWYNNPTRPRVVNRQSGIGNP